MAKDKYWITSVDMDKSPSQMYRAYIFNFQEDMWQFVYTKVNKSTKNQRSASKKIFKILKENEKMFKRHLKDPDDIALIDYHVQRIETLLNELLLEFGDETGNTFYRGALKVHDEFGFKNLGKKKRL